MSNDPVIMDFARAISEARRIKGLLKVDLAAIITVSPGKHMSPQYLQDIESGSRTPHSEHVIRQFASILDINPDYLFYLANRWPPDLRTPAMSGERFARAMREFRSTPGPA